MGASTGGIGAPTRTGGVGAPTDDTSASTIDMVRNSTCRIAELDVRSPTYGTWIAELDARNWACRTRIAELDVRNWACRTRNADLDMRNYRITKPMPGALLSTHPKRDAQVSTVTVLSESQHVGVGPSNRQTAVSSCSWAGRLDQTVTTWPAGLVTRGRDWTRPSPKRVRPIPRQFMVTDPWDGPESTPTNSYYLEAKVYLRLVPATVFIVIVLLICAIKNHFCGILQLSLILRLLLFHQKNS